jgi:hypothetical protein
LLHVLLSPLLFCLCISVLCLLHLLYTLYFACSDAFQVPQRAQLPPQLQLRPRLVVAQLLH